MALQIWLPLNGNLKSCGLTQVEAINNGGVVSDDGKIGKCYSLNGTSNTINTGYGNGLSTGDELSVCLWVKPNGTNESKMAFRTLGTSPGRLYVGIKNGTWNLSFGNTAWGRTTSAPITDGSWQHIVVTIKNGLAKLYCDGKFVESFSNTFELPSNIVLGGSSSYYFKGFYNDVRIYDNCLSDEDIKELYWGKVLEVTPQWRDADRIHDASGFNFPLTPHNLTVTGNTILFNGTSSYIEFNGLDLKSGGTVSIWASLPAKPTAQRIYYCDPSSKMVIGYLAGGTILTAANSVSKPSYQSTGITWGQMHHIVAVYGNDRHPSAFYVNGVQPATGTSSNWTNSGEIASIGRRLGSGGADYLSGSVNEVKVFASPLTAEDAMALYKAGPNPNVWGEIYPNIDLPNWEGMYMTYSGCTWVKVLHHNNPSANLFTAANCKNNTATNLFSRLYLFDDTDRFKMTDGRYEFMVREKINSNSTENIGMWVQTSSPTAGTVAGYKQLYKSTAVSRDFGLVHQTTRTHFDNKASWWCACGSYTAYEGGTPGFWGTVKTGYIDLYIRVDNTPFFNKPL